MAERLDGPLQESILTLLVTNSAEGGIAASLLKPQDFDGEYHELVERVIGHHVQYKRAPGKEHLDDLVNELLSRSKNDRKLASRKKFYEATVTCILEQADGLNAKYVLNRISGFTRAQNLKACVLKAAERFTESEEDLVPDVENILHAALKSKQVSFDAGVFLNDRTKALSFLDEPVVPFLTGVEALDKRHIGPARGEILVYIAGKNTGKSWFCIQIAKVALLQRLKVLHISLEMSEKRLLERYFQALFAIGKWNEPFIKTFMEFNSLGHLAGLRTKRFRRPKLNYEDPNIGRYLGKRIDSWGSRLGNLCLKQFPTNQFTMSMLRAYLDGLALNNRFVPDIMIIDYPDLMKHEGQDPRIGMGRTLADIRGLCIERNMAGICPKQVNRGGLKASQVTSSDVAEDISAGFTADVVLAYSQTPLEYEYKLARLFVDKARYERDRFWILLAQNYDLGQYCLESTLMGSNYWDQLKELNGGGASD